MKSKKILTILLSIMLIFNSFGFAYADTDTPRNKPIINKDKAHQLYIADRVNNSIIELGFTADSNKEIELLVISQLESDITSKLYKAGASVVDRFVEGAYKIKINTKDAYKMANISELVSVGVNKTVEIDPPQRVSMELPKLEYSNQDTTIKDLWNAGYNGEGTTVAIVDTGVEPDHELLKVTTTGKLKLVDYQDFTGAGFFTDSPTEGDIKLAEISSASTTLTVPYQYLDNNIVKDATKQVTIPAELVGKTLLGGVFSELKMVKEDGHYFDINNNGMADRYAVLCYDTDGDGIYDRMLFDTNNDLNMTNDKAIGIYKNVAAPLKDKQIFEMSNGKPVVSNNELVLKDEFKSQYNMLFNTIDNSIKDPSDIKSKTKFNFVCTRIDRETFGSWYVNIAYDSRGHGTHVAGDAAANGYLDHDFVDKTLDPSGSLVGPAPGAQLMALRVFTSTGGTSEDMYIRAMQYAAVNGADVANLSLGSQPDFTDGSGLGAAYADLLTIKYGIIYVISNGNNGPGINSNGIPGDSWFAITAGAYCPSFYVVGSKYKNAEDQMWVFSASGPTDDGRIKPDVVAPGSMVSSAPMWDVIGKGYTEETNFKDMDETGKLYVGYCREQGTSMSAPYIAGSAAALRQAIKTENLKYHPLLFKEVIKKTANKSLNGGKYNPAEIGSGMIDPMAAYNELKVMNTSAKLPQLVTGDNPVTTWPYDYNDKLMKYKTYYDMYLYPNVLYKNDDRMRSSEGHGIYVRDKEIPSTVDIELQNVTGRIANLNIAKITYGQNQKTDWLNVPNTLVIQDGKKVTLTVNIDSTKLADGVNCLLLQLDDPNTYQLDCTVPVTIINSSKLSFKNPTVKAENTPVSPGAYIRKFVTIENDLESFNFSVEVPEGTNGRVRPVIYFPNGIQYVWPQQYDYAGVQNATEIAAGKPVFVKKVSFTINKAALEAASLDTSKRNSNPTWKWGGAWEIDLYCSYASAGQVIPTLTVNTSGTLLSEKSKSINMGAGESYDGSVTISNTTGSDLNLKSHGFISMEKNKVKQRIEGYTEFKTMERGFQIKAGERNVFHRVIITNPSYGDGARVWLYLYKAKLNADGSYEIIKPMINKYINVQVNGMESEMTTYNLAPGYYIYALFGGMMEHGPVDFDLITQIVNESDAVQDTLKIEGPSVIKNGQSATIRYTAKAPVESGKYNARITFEDSNSQIVKSFPIYADVEGTKKVVQLKQENIALMDGEIMMNVNAAFPEDTPDRDKLYGIEFEMNYNPQELSAKEILPGSVFTAGNSYKVKTEIVKNAQGNETGVIKFAYAFKGITFDGIKTGNIAKVKFLPKKIGVFGIDLGSLIVGNSEGDALAVKIEKQNIITADPDVNHDGMVNIKDYSYCAYSYGADTSDVRYREQADVNGDGIINDTDLNYIIQYFNF